MSLVLLLLNHYDLPILNLQPFFVTLEFCALYISFCTYYNTLIALKMLQV